MGRRSGRPRVNLEQQILADMSAREKQAEEIVAQKIDSNTPSIMAFEAACLLLAVERGADPKTVQGTAIFQKINQYARAHGPHGKWRGACDFLEEFIQHYAPNWNWREEARQGEIEDRNYARENERVAKEHADDVRSRLGRRSRFFTPDIPDAFLLQHLAWEWRRFARKQRRVVRKEWPTLRELKLATAIPERALEKIVRRLQPKKAEMTKEPQIVPLAFDMSRRKLTRRGAVPLRYGPRLVVGVLNEFLKRLPGVSIADEEQKELRKVAIRVKRAFVSRLSRSR
jgi:hypothetical protein